jgi:hypothetical protein
MRDFPLIAELGVRRYDTSKDLYVDLGEIAETWPMRTKAVSQNISTRLGNYLYLVLPPRIPHDVLHAVAGCWQPAVDHVLAVSEQRDVFMTAHVNESRLTRIRTGQWTSSSSCTWYALLHFHHGFASVTLHLALLRLIFVGQSFLMSGDGCYTDLVFDATASNSVKMLFLRILSAYEKADSSGDPPNSRHIVDVDLHSLSRQQLGGVMPAAFRTCL